MECEDIAMVGQTPSYELNNEQLYYLRMKMECIIKMHYLVDDTLSKFDQKGIAPKLDEINNYRKQSPIKSNLNAELKIALDAIKKEISSLENTGYKIVDIRKGIITWNQDSKEYKWEYLSNNYEELELV